MNAYFTTTNDHTFTKDLLLNVNAYFKGKSKKANALFWLKTLINLITFIGLYLFLILKPHNLVSLIILFISLGIQAIILVMNVAHDASHGACSERKWVNRLFSQVWNLFGSSSYFWHLKHNESHHPLTNVTGYDGDIEQSKLIRLSPASDWKPYHRFQHLYAFFLYSLIGVFIVYVRDFRMLSTYKFGNRIIRYHSPWILGGLILSKAFFFIVMVIVPKVMLQLSWIEILSLHFIMLMALGLVITLLLIPAHTNHETHFTHPDSNGCIPKSFFENQLESTVDFEAGNYFVNWFAGGLNTHVVHHLFPGVCHIHYFRLTRIVKETASRHGLTYQNVSFFNFIKEHFVFLKKLGENPVIIN